MIGSALIGCGNISNVHIAAIRSSRSVNLRAFYDPKRERAEAKANEFGGIVANSVEQVLDDDGVQAVHILSPHCFHADQIRQSLARGKHVLCEKPMATSVSDALDLIKLDPVGDKLCVIFQNRYNPSSIAAKKIIESGELGEIVTLKAFVTWHRDAGYYNDDWHGKLSLECGGVLINQAIHTVDLMMWLAGKPSRIKGCISTDLLKGAIEVEDNAHAVIEYEAGHVGLIYASNNFGVDESPEIKIVFEKATLLISGDDLYQIDRSSGARKLIASRDGSQNLLGKAMYGFSHPQQIREFYSDIEQRKRHRISAAEAYAAVWAVASIYESAKMNEWVKFVDHN